MVFITLCFTPISESLKKALKSMQQNYLMPDSCLMTDCICIMAYTQSTHNFFLPIMPCHVALAQLNIYICFFESQLPRGIPFDVGYSGYRRLRIFFIIIIGIFMGHR